jgi:hypothetical protein
MEIKRQHRIRTPRLDIVDGTVLRDLDVFTVPGHPRLHESAAFFRDASIVH